MSRITKRPAKVAIHKQPRPAPPPRQRFGYVGRRLAGTYAQQDEAQRKAGRYTLEEAAAALAQKSGWQPDRWLATISEAVKAEDLPLRNPKDFADRLPFAVSAELLPYYHQVYAGDVDAWLDKHPEWSAARLGDTVATAIAESITSIRPPKPLPRQRYQEQEILRVIVDELKYTAKALPKRTPGKPWVKAEVRAKLDLSPSVFDKAWERLRKDCEIQDVT